MAKSLVEQLRTNPNQPLHSVIRWEVSAAALVLGFVGLTALALALTTQYYSDKFFPNTVVDSIAVGGLPEDTALSALKKSTAQPKNYTLTLYVDDIVSTGTSAQIPIADSYPTLLNEVFSQQHQGNFITQGLLIFQQLVKPATHTSTLSLDSIRTKEFVAELASRVEIVGTEPSAELASSNNPSTLTIHPGTPGRTVATAATIRAMEAALQSGEFLVAAIVASTSSPLTDAAQITARERASKFVGASLLVHAGDEKASISDKAIMALLAFPSGFSDTKLAELISGWETAHNRQPTPAEFTFTADTLEVTSFMPPKDGLALNRVETQQQLLQALSQIESATDAATQVAITLPFTQTPPKKTLAETNDLGITERIGVGNSEYHGSILTRVHNVGITSERITNQIVRPGEEYSFNQALGEVSSRTGFKPAYVIRAGKTELGDGGGVCQVSSTLFRALLDSGLDITRRLQHSYRVGYYELNSDPGFDATVYSGNVDLRFKNDTKHHVLIHVENDSEARSMRVELYGTSDGRRTEILDYEKWGAVGAPAPEYILDPTLQPGQRVQIDWAVGGLKTKFTHKVYKSDGELLRENTYYSNYRPWSAKYRVGALPN